MNHYMKSKGINFELQGRVRKYLEYMMLSETDVEKENEILSRLTFALKKELILESNGKHLKQAPLFYQNFSEKALEQLCFSLKELKFCPEEFVYHVFPSLFNKKRIFSRRIWMSALFS